MNPTSLRRRSFLGLAGAAAGSALLGACSRSSSGSKASDAKQINWWHIANTDPLLSVWAKVAQDFEAAHPGLKVNITPLENEAFKAKLTTVTQAGNPPDLFHS